MAKTKKIKSVSQKPIEQYEHKDKQRLNNPPVGLVPTTVDRRKRNTITTRTLTRNCNGLAKKNTPVLKCLP